MNQVHREPDFMRALIADDEPIARGRLRDILLLPALAVALIGGCDGGAAVEPAPQVHVTSVDTLRPGQTSYVRGSGLTNLRSLLLDRSEERRVGKECRSRWAP